MRPTPTVRDAPVPAAMPDRAASALGRCARCLGIAWCAAVIIGCSGRVPPPDISKDPYTGPPLSLEDWSGRQLLVARPPSPGYSVSVDRVMDGWGHQAAYVTVRSPNPAYGYPPTPVLQRVETNVPVATPLLVFARTEDFTGASPTKEAYSAVEIAPLVPAPPPKTAQPTPDAPKSP